MATKKKATTKKKAKAVSKRAPGRPRKPLDGGLVMRRAGYTQQQIAVVMDECQFYGLESMQMLMRDVHRRYKQLEKEYEELELMQVSGFNGNLTTDYGGERTTGRQRLAEKQEKVDQEKEALGQMMKWLAPYVMPQKRSVEADVRVQSVTLVDILKAAGD